VAIECRCRCISCSIDCSQINTRNLRKKSADCKQTWPRTLDAACRALMTNATPSFQVAFPTTKSQLQIEIQVEPQAITSCGGNSNSNNYKSIKSLPGFSSSFNAHQAQLWVQSVHRKSLAGFSIGRITRFTMAMGRQLSLFFPPWRKVRLRNFPQLPHNSDTNPNCLVSAYSRVATQQIFG